jgi:hypothetical protein
MNSESNKSPTRVTFGGYVYVLEIHIFGLQFREYYFCAPQGLTLFLLENAWLDYNLYAT